MRLIDADKLKEVLEDSFVTESKDTLLNIIDRQSTIYNIDHVMRKLSRDYEYAIEMLNGRRGTEFEYAAKVRCDTYRVAIEIVKAGGIN